ncbi:GNAT family N-acetyltransferase [Oceanobacillus neutriphilus]|uniref:N-acetyltransferase n=1 Tax=Oceanobacillus neutriphilus TaxID=531815 RepID=A0ABQ2NNP1_9BACI|nr:GNAT family N-acetyltransferase [Oceanobacillus neutriphilus]GGP07433.1 N-acetyltransferase [Oceanobacillus neutriphilus]
MQKKYYLKKMNPTNINVKVLYNYLKQDFERQELFPQFVLKRNFKKERMEAVYLTDGQEKYGYAIYQELSAFKGIFISYLAILPKYRSNGLGGELISQLNDLSPNGMLLEVEDPEAAKGKKDYTTRLRRISFYERNGLHMNSNMKVNSFFVPLRMMDNLDKTDAYDISFYQRLYNRILGLPLGRIFIKENN